MSRVVLRMMDKQIHRAVVRVGVGLGLKGTGIVRVTTYENEIEYDAREGAAKLVRRAEKEEK